MSSTSSMHSASALRSVSPVSSLAPLRILIADDHPITREGLAALIGRQEGISVVAEACNGQEAVALFREHQPDIALLDLRMPGMNGLEALKAIQGAYPQARVILLSGFDTQEDYSGPVCQDTEGSIFKLGSAPSFGGFCAER